MPLSTLLDIAKLNGSDGVVGLVEETTKAHPELMRIPSRTIRSTSYKTVVRTALGQTTGGFRAANAGVSPVKSTFENRTVETFMLEAHWKADKMVADAYEDGPAAFIALEAAGLLEGEMQGLARQFYYGNNATFGNVLGFPGLLQAYDATNMVVDATGTTDNVATSIWLVKYGPQAVTWVWGNGGELKLTPSPNSVLSQPILVTDPNDATKQFLAYFQGLTARPGLQVGSVQSVVRIKKITTDSSKGATDALIAEGLSKFKVGDKPDVIFMNRRSGLQLQKSRSVTIMTGPTAKVASSIESTAPVPDSAFGIPIEVTDAISSTETLAL